MNILIVDDDPEIMAMYKDLFISNGNKYEFANNGFEAYEKIKNNPNYFHLLVSDIVMPVWDGLKAAYEIRKLESTLEIFFCSGFMTSDYENRIRVDFDKSSIFTKPKGLIEMINIITTKTEFVRTPTYKHSVGLHG